jgi:hypothetical protein
MTQIDDLPNKNVKEGRLYRGAVGGAPLAKTAGSRRDRRRRRLSEIN